MTLNEFIQFHGIEHFTGDETLQLLRLGETAPVPPKSMWQNILPALRLAEEIRELVGHPLVVGNGYRPRALNKRAGGARNSQHIYYRALDLDLPRSLAGLRQYQSTLYAAVATVFLRHPNMKIGFGIYRRNAGNRVHIDAGGRWRRAAWGPGVKDLLKEHR